MLAMFAMARFDVPDMVIPLDTYRFPETVRVAGASLVPTPTFPLL